ncbi:hypothetical protein SAMN05443550_11579 [Pedobacter hartonius]|uniref:Uncharacterized protein n=1 Tax=Pedobacter hartonius TaxID=425514 RepID=A0A1H4HCQ4_9SPHI|nr:hypothetical protein SAMN05443550_11579 [Pedobacter hartonius]
MTHKIEILGLTVLHYINFVADIKNKLSTLHDQ